METCTFSDFMEALKPWLSSDYIRKAYRDDRGHFRLLFVDGGQKAFRIDGCTQAQVKDVVALLQENGVSIEE